MYYSNQYYDSRLQYSFCAAEEKRQTKKSVSTAGFITLASLGLMIAIVFISELCLLPALLGGNKGAASGLAECFGYMALAVIPLIFIIRRSRKGGAGDFLPFSNPRSVGLTGSDMFVMCLSAFMLMLAGNLPTQAVRWIENSFGLTQSSSQAIGNTAEEQILYVIYGVIIPPIVEEILFRGAVLGSLRRYGDRFAIAVSAILFGMYHGNFEQFVFATLAGLVFGYLRVRTESMAPSMLLHFLNNGLAIATSIIAKDVGDSAADIFSAVYIFGVPIFALIVLLISIKKKGKDYFSKMELPKEKVYTPFQTRVGTVFTSVGGLVMTAYFLISSFASVGAFGASK